MKPDKPSTTQAPETLESLKKRVLELERENSIQKKLISAIPQLINYVDCDLRYRYVGPAYEKWFVPPKLDIVGKHVSDVIDEDSLAKVLPIMKRALAGETVEFELSFPFGQGPLRFVNARYIPDISSSGEVLGFVVLLTDLSEREINRRRLRESESRIQQVFDNVPIGIVQLDEERHYVSANATYCKYIGYS